MKERETISQFHRKFKEILDRLHSISEQIKNRDLIKYAFKVFSRTISWASMINAYKVFREIELYEQTLISRRNVQLKSKSKMQSKSKV